MQSRGARVARGTLAASVATFTALFSHVVAGGQMPGWIGILAPLILATAACTLLVGRRLSAVRLTGAVAASQALFHALFVLGAPLPPVGDPSIALSAHAHHHGALELALLAPGTGSALAADATMWVGHALAAAVTVAVLYRGERAVTRLHEIAVGVARWLFRPVAVAATPVVLPAVAHIVPRGENTRVRSQHELLPLLRRGPPHPIAL